MKNICILFIFVFLLSALNAKEYQDNDWAANGRLGTLGLGLELTYDINPVLNARAGLNNFTYDYDSTESDVEYEVEFALSSYELLLDFFPFKGSFHATVGFLNNKNELNMDGRVNPGTTSEIGESLYTDEQVGLLSAKIDFDSFAPYLGIGWGNPVIGNRVHFIVDLGIVLQGEPSVKLSSTGGSLSYDETFLNELAKEEADIEDDLSGFKIYPVISIGLSFSF